MAAEAAAMLPIFKTCRRVITLRCYSGGAHRFKSAGCYSVRRAFAGWTGTLGLSRGELGRGDEALHVSQLRPGGFRAVVGRFEQGGVELLRLDFVSRLFGGHAGVVEAVEAVGTELQRDLVLGERLL